MGRYGHWGVLGFRCIWMASHVSRGQRSFPTYAGILALLAWVAIVFGQQAQVWASMVRLGCQTVAASMRFHEERRTPSRRIVETVLQQIAQQHSIRKNQAGAMFIPSFSAHLKFHSIRLKSRITFPFFSIRLFVACWRCPRRLRHSMSEGFSRSHPYSPYFNSQHVRLRKNERLCGRGDERLGRGSRRRSNNEFAPNCRESQSLPSLGWENHDDSLATRACPRKSRAGRRIPPRPRA